MKPNILTIGGTGLVGSRVNELLSEKYTIENVGTSTGVDITKPETLINLQTDIQHKIVILFAAKADVDACEKDKELGEAGDAYKINVTGVKNVVDACSKNNKKLIYFSTGFVFSGNNPPKGGYKEDDAPGPVNWYGETKRQGEEIIRNSGLPFLIIRIDYPYRKEFAAKKDFFRAILGRLQSDQPVIAITDNIITPTFVDDIAPALDKLISVNAEGVYHAVGSQSLTPFAAAHLIARTFSLPTSLISKADSHEFFTGRATRPFDLRMNNVKIGTLEIKMKTFAEGLKEVKS